jgi:hypothetical protein
VTRAWTIDELFQKLDELEVVLTDAQRRTSSIRTYVDRTKILRCLDGDYEPRGPAEFDASTGNTQG